MRDIKFKGISKMSKKWIVGDLLQIGKDFSDNKGLKTPTEKLNTTFKIRENINTKRSGFGNVVFEESICEFTGLYDQNGCEIYENDYFMDEHDGHIMPIVLEEGCYMVNDENALIPLFEMHNSYCVMGNTKNVLLKGEK